MSVPAILAPVVLLANGLAAGVLMGTQLGGWPLLASLPPDRYVHAHAFFSTRYDPFMPICLLVTVFGSVALGLFAEEEPATAAHLIAGLFALLTVVVSLVKNVPLNRWLRTLDPDDLPEDFEDRDPRRTWGGWNRARTGMAVLALIFNCAALGLSMWDMTS